MRNSEVLLLSDRHRLAVIIENKIDISPLTH
jgi:hypothetical protein